VNFVPAQLLLLEFLML